MLMFIDMGEGGIDEKIIDYVDLGRAHHDENIQAYIGIEIEIFSYFI